MIKLKMNHLMFDVIQEDIYSEMSSEMCGGEKGSPRILKKDFFGRMLSTVKITLGEYDYHNVLIYEIELSEEDFLILYNATIWAEYEGFGAIKYDYYKKQVQELCRYLIKVKEEHNLVSTLDDFENLLWFLESDNSEFI
jgi:hypothetical protein